MAKKRDHDAAMLHQLTTQRRYLEEKKNKDKPKGNKDEQKKDPSWKKWVKKLTNFPTEKDKDDEKEKKKEEKKAAIIYQGHVYKPMAPKVVRFNGALYQVVAALDAFTQAYIDAALWDSMDNDGVALEKNYDQSDIAPECLQAMVADCAKFQEANEAVLDAADVKSRYTKDEQAGHDFWLTRNETGAGFWDGDWTEPEGKKLTEAAQAFGKTSLYVGDDGLVYCFSG